MNNDWAFLPMRQSNDLLGDPEALRARLDDDGYLLLRDVIDPQRVLEVRRGVLEALAAHGWVVGGWNLMKGLAAGPPTWEGRTEFAAGYDAVQRVEALHELAFDDDLTEVMRQVRGDSAWPHPLKIARVAFPSNYELSTPPHQDYPNNQGTEALTATWIPLGDIPRELGGIAVLRGSHRYGLLPLDTHPGAGNRQCRISDEMAEALHWVTTDFRCGDVLVFPSLTVHASLHNATELEMRLSVDYRWQLEGEALTEVVLHPHFQRLTWDDVYEGWSDEAHRYYWRDKRYEVVPFRDLFRTDFDTAPDTPLHDEVQERIADGRLELSDEEWQEVFRLEQVRQLRFERRQAALAALLGDEAAASPRDDR